MRKKYIDLEPDDFSDEVYSLIPGLISVSTFERLKARRELEGLISSHLDEAGKLINSSENQLRWEVALSLKNKRLIRSIPLLIRLLGDYDSGTRWIAAEALIKTGRKSIIPLSEAVMGDSPHALFEGAHHVLNELFTENEKKRHSHFMHALKHYNSPAAIRFKAKQFLLEFNGT
jgi:HEAT repeat protein